MSKQTINIGASPNDGTGTPLRTSFDYTNQNFTEIYTALGGGVALPGATTQVIFNDGGTNLAGDAGLVYNKTTDALTVAGLVTAGSATITGAATVGTTLAVTGNLTAAADSILGTGSKATDTLLDFKADTGTQRIYLDRGGRNLIFKDVTTNIENYRITGVTGVHTWGVGGSTAMTLNSTGLGVGVSPITALSFPIGTTKIVAQSAVTAHLAGNAGTMKFGISDGGGDYSGLHVVNSHNGTYSSQDLLFFTGEGGVSSCTERMRITRSGNVGIGVTPSAWAASGKAIDIGAYGVSIANTAGYQATFGNNCFYDGAWKYKASGYQAALYTQNSGYHIWSVKAAGTINTAINFTDAMTLDASGNLLVGTTVSLPSFANGRIEVLAAASSYCIVADATATSAAAIGIRGNDSTVAASFYNASTGGTVGSIVINSGGVSYNTTSDYRLKESVKPISGGLARVNALKPSIYNWKSNGSTGEGFIAHELAEVVPFAVSGEKDAVNADGTIKSQGIDMSRIVPILVAAIQELTARVQTLEAR